MKNKLILGTVQLGKKYGINNSTGLPSFDEVKKILEFAHANGIKTLDTAEAYGESQFRIGKFHEKSNQRFQIITKYSPSESELDKNIFNRVCDNIKIMKVDHLYGYMFHSYKDYKRFYNDFKKDLIKLRSLKKIKKIGVSVHSNDEILKVIKNREIGLIQLPFNLLDNSSQRKEILENVNKLGVEIHTRSPFLQGLFFKNFKKLKGNLFYLKQDLLKISEIVLNKKEIGRVALNYACSKKIIDKVVIGVETLEQLRSNLSALDYELSPNIEKRIDKIIVKNQFYLNPVNW